MGYILVNPRIPNSSFESSRKDPMEAADMIWAKLSENIKQYTSKYFFTIQNKKTSKLIHFEVNEEMEGGNDDSISSTDRNSSNRVKCTISEHKNADSHLIKKFLDELSIEQAGGKSKFLDDSSSSSSSSSIVYNISSSTTTFPLTYFPTIYNVTDLILPTYVGTFTPFTKLVFLS